MSRVENTRRASLVVVAVLAVSCGGGSTVPVTPTPTAAPTATNPPAKTPGPVGSAFCGIGDGVSPPFSKCNRRTIQHLGAVEAAIELAITEHPEVFDLTSEARPGTREFKVKDRAGYTAWVLENLREAGFCADRDYASLELIQVKNSNNISEDYDIYADSGYSLRGRPSYVQTCAPASFPVDRGADAPPAGSGCGEPYPPEIARYRVKILLKNTDYYTLDATAEVGPHPDYCATVGFTDGRIFCPMRPEGGAYFDQPQCEAWRAGIAKDTGEPGPTWVKDSTYCTGPASGCERTQNPAQVIAYTGSGLGWGTYQVCDAHDICGYLTIP
jgi:hypothetical protein